MDNSGAGYDGHQFIACVNRSGKPHGNVIGGGTNIFYGDSPIDKPVR